MPPLTLHWWLLKQETTHGLKLTLMVPMLTLSLAGSLDGEFHWIFYLGLLFPTVLDNDTFGSNEEWTVGWKSGVQEHNNNVGETTAIAMFFSLLDLQ